MQYQNPPLPKDLYTAGNVRFDTRQLGQMLYQEQKMRQFNQAREDAELNKQYGQEIGKVLAVDRPKAIQLYQDWKKNKQALLFDKKLQRDPLAYANAQRAADLKQQEFLQHTGASAERHNFIKENQQLDPDKRSDDYGNLMSTYMQTPVEQLGKAKVNGKETDLSNYDTYRYMGGNYDPAKVLKDARGEDDTIEINAGPADKSGLTDNIIHYKVPKNNPAQAKATILGAMGTREGNKYFSALLSNLTPDDIKEVEDKYAAIPDSEWKKTGREKIDVQIENPDSKADVISTYLAKKIALENLPREVKTEQRVNEYKKRELNRQDQRSDALFRQGLEQDNIRLRAKLKEDVEGAGGVNSYMDAIIKDATPSTIKKDTGETVEIFDIKSSPADRKMFSVDMMNGDKKITVDPDRLILSKDKKYITPIFYQGEEVNGHKGIDKELSKPVLVEQVAARWGKELGGTAVNKESFGVPSKKKGATKAEIKIEELRKKYGDW